MNRIILIMTCVSLLAACKKDPKDTDLLIGIRDVASNCKKITEPMIERLNKNEFNEKNREELAEILEKLPEPSGQLATVLARFKKAPASRPHIADIMAASSMVKCQPGSLYQGLDKLFELSAEDKELRKRARKLMHKHFLNPDVVPTLVDVHLPVALGRKHKLAKDKQHQAGLDLFRKELKAFTKEINESIDWVSFENKNIEVPEKTLQRYKLILARELEKSHVYKIRLLKSF